MYPKMPFRSSNGYELETARPQLVQMMQALSYWVRRDIPLRAHSSSDSHRRMGRCLHGMGQLGIAELRELISFVSSLPRDRDGPSPYRPTATREPKFDVTLGY